MEGGFDRWRYGRCYYKCAQCHREYCGSIIFWHHVKTEHNVSVSDYKSTHPNPLVMCVWLRCSLCFERIMYDYGKMILHLNKRHEKMELEEFYRTTIVCPRIPRRHATVMS
jgi:hypothetical protein